ncbi:MULTISPECIES: hypothetical protein [unclassified Methylobacterium]|uniref:hypothetical protein n=1 Tax=unclassified Methylobacterium TaxID=2615210 RepID=UPI001FB9EB4E|nr:MULTISPECIES: hypothetical protein [unclassified Methylobacterium]MCJ2017592.1 hypothetical protein [Methylobacterium sp. E-065]
MAYVTIEKDGEPWMLCHSTHAGEIERQIETARAKAPTATFTQRPSTPIESQHCADAMDAQEGVVEDPFKFFAYQVVDDSIA